VVLPAVLELDAILDGGEAELELDCDLELVGRSELSPEAELARELERSGEPTCSPSSGFEATRFSNAYPELSCASLVIVGMAAEEITRHVQPAPL
jgi:hypothetical protein